MQKFFGALLLGAFFVTPLHAREEYPYSRLNPCPYQELFEKARDIVADMPATHSTTATTYTETLVYPRYKKPRTRTDFTKRVIPMVLLNTSTCELTKTSVTRVVSGHQLPTVLSTNDARFIIFIEERAYGAVWNWWNTPLQVLAPSGYVVAAIHWKDRLSGKSILYTPGAGDLLTTHPSLADIGREHFRFDLTLALERLKSVPSRGVPGKSVAEVLQSYFPRLLESIVAIEHADDYEVAVYRDGLLGINPLDRPFLVIAGNPETAYAFTRSSAGARGLMQVMPATCADMRTLYPQAKIPSGCFEMPHPHVVELATASLVVDYHLSILARHLRDRDETYEEFANRPQMKLMLRAAYNGGPGRVTKAVRTRKDWIPRLLVETRGYLVKAFGLDEPLK